MGLEAGGSALCSPGHVHIRQDDEAACAGFARTVLDSLQAEPRPLHTMHCPG